MLRSRLFVTVRLLPESITSAPTSALMSRLTAAAAWPSLMQTVTVGLFGTASVLQFEALLQLLLPPPPVQIVAPEALQAVVPVKLNVAVTVWLEFIVTTQEPLPPHAPLHPANVEPTPGVALSVTLAP